MTRLIAHEHSTIPPDVAETYVGRYLDALGRDAELTLCLRVPGEDFGIGVGIAVEKTVRARISSQLDATHRNRVMTIAWEPDGGGPFPTFEGTIGTIADDDGNGSAIVLAGQYVPPGGIAGMLFDAAIGFWIARASVRDLLERIRAGAEALYARRDVAAV